MHYSCWGLHNSTLTIKVLHNWSQVQNNISFRTILNPLSKPESPMNKWKEIPILKFDVQQDFHIMNSDQQPNPWTTSHQLHVKKLRLRRLRRLDTSSLQLMRNLINPKPHSDTLRVGGSSKVRTGQNSLLSILGWTFMTHYNTPQLETTCR